MIYVIINLFFERDDLVFNVLFQCFLAIYTFHKLGYSHNDCHWGNFLYQISKKTDGYFHYIIEGKNYYLKNCGYNMMIYDFGLAKRGNNSGFQRRVVDDYRRVINAFRNRSYGGWVELKGLPRDTVSQSVQDINQLLLDIIGDKDQEDYAFTKRIIPAFLACPINDIFLEALPVGSRVANKQPFIIDAQNINVTLLNPLSSPLAANP